MGRVKQANRSDRGFLRYEQTDVNLDYYKEHVCPEEMICR